MHLSFLRCISLNYLFGQIMIPKNSVKPLELVISALHCLKERKGSSPQNILKYLVDKYNVSAEAIKVHVQSGLKRGLSFGLITQKSGLYRLNDVLSSPSNVSETKFDRKKNKFIKSSKVIKKKKLRTIKKGRRKYTTCAPLKGRRKSNRKSKEKKEKKKKKPAFLKVNPPRNLNESKRRKPNRQKSKPDKFIKTKIEKVKRILPEGEIETPPAKTEGTEAQHSNVNDEEFEFVKTNVKA